MTTDEYVTLSRDDAYWLLDQGRRAAWFTAPDESVARFERITSALDAQPRRQGRPEGDPDGFDVFMVNVEYTEGPPIAVRTTAGAAIEIAKAFNLAEGERTAEVVGYRFDGIGQGVSIPLDN